MPGHPLSDSGDSPRPTAPNTERPKNRETEYEDRRVPAEDGQPPRSATEPKGSEGSAKNPYTATDPETGEPQGHPAKPQSVGSEAENAAKRRP